MPSKVINTPPTTPPPKSSNTRTASVPESSGVNSEFENEVPQLDSNVKSHQVKASVTAPSAKKSESMRIDVPQLDSNVKSQAKASVPASSAKKSESMIEGPQLDSTVKPHRAVLEKTDSCNTAADKTSSSTPTSTQDSLSDDIIQKCRIQFNSAVFGNDLQQTRIKLHGNSTNKIYSQEDINGIIAVMKSFSETSSAEYRRENKKGFYLKKKFIVRESYFTEDGQNCNKDINHSKLYLVRFEENDKCTKGHNKIVCAAEDCFDAILQAHTKVGHKRVASTKNKLDEMYYNISEGMVKTFIAMCPICTHINDNTKKKSKGPGIGIKSAGFRDRIQVDLVDFSSDPCLDHNGVVMKWLMVVKDHFTKTVWLHPLRKKEAKLVAAELRMLFHDIGFPLIFHTDNGTEFINVLVYNLLVEADEGILLVSGASRTPRHQGSVENSNRHIKTIIQKELTTMTSKNPGTDIGWVNVLPQVTSAMNSSVGYGQGLLTPYRHVFSQDFEFPYSKPVNERSKIRTIEALDKFVNDPVLSEKLKILMNDIDSASQKNSHVPLGSEKVISYRETKKPLESSDDATSSTTSSHPMRPKFIQSAHAVLQVHPNTRVLCNAGNPSFSFVLAHFSPELCQIAETKVINRSSDKTSLMGTTKLRAKV